MYPDFVESLLKQAYVAKLVRFPPQKRKVTYLVSSCLFDFHSTYLKSFLNDIADSDFKLYYNLYKNYIGISL